MVCYIEVVFIYWVSDCNCSSKRRPVELVMTVFPSNDWEKLVTRNVSANAIAHTSIHAEQQSV